MSMELLTGAPGGGKSYVAVSKYLPVAIQSGRLIVTNLPLNLNAIATRYGDEAVSRIHKRKFKTSDFDGTYLTSIRERIEAGEENVTLEMFGVSWSAGEQGPLLLIDEAGDVLGQKMPTEQQMLYFRYHRHSGADLVLIAQAETYVDIGVRKACDRFWHVHNNSLVGVKSFTLERIDIQQGVPIPKAPGAKRDFTQIPRKQEIYDLYTSRTMGGGSGGDAQRFGVVPWYRQKIMLMMFAMVLVGLIFTVTGFMNLSDSQLLSDKPTVPPAVSEQVRRTTNTTAPAPTASERSGVVLVGVVPGGYVVKEKGQLFIKKERVDRVSGACGIIRDGIRILCGSTISEQPKPVSVTE